MSPFERDVQKITEIAKKNGLEPFPMRYEIVPADVIHSFGIYGTPTRHNHWTFGKQYAAMNRMREEGLLKMYEMVLNSNPCYALFSEDNSETQNKTIIAHVLAHSDFFKNNFYFKKSNRNMVEKMEENKEIVREMYAQYGNEPVERILDVAFSVKDQVSILKFLAEAKHLKEWEQRLVRIVLEESQYFEPQKRTKIVNEGWATFWHQKIIKQVELNLNETAEYVRLNQEVLRPSEVRLNPYLLGFSIFKEIEKKFGMDKIFEVRTVEDDTSFIRNYLDEDVVASYGMFLHQHGFVTEVEFEEVKKELLSQILHQGVPVITAAEEEDKIVLKHLFDGRGLDLSQAKKVMYNLVEILQKPVALQTQKEEGSLEIMWDGKKEKKQCI